MEKIYDILKKYDCSLIYNVLEDRVEIEHKSGRIFKNILECEHSDAHFHINNNLIIEDIEQAIKKAVEEIKNG